MSEAHGELIERAKRACDQLDDQLDRIFASLNREKTAQERLIEGIIAINRSNYERSNNPLFIWVTLLFAPYLSSRVALKWCDEYLLSSASKLFDNIDQNKAKGTPALWISHALGFKVGGKNQNPFQNAKNLRRDQGFWVYVKMRTYEGKTTEAALRECADKHGAAFSVVKKAYYDTDSQVRQLNLADL
jgi:hypothetical protein